MAISPADVSYFAHKFGSMVKYLPAFHSNNHISSEAGDGAFVLYHGNLSVGENNFAALYLVNEVFDNRIEFQNTFSNCGSKSNKSSYSGS